MALNAPQPAPAANVDKVRQVELLISAILRIGVVVSLFVILAGLVVSFSHHPDFVRSGTDLARLTRPGARFPHTVSEVLAGLRHFEGRAITILGLLILVATPVVRVAVSIFAFVYEKDAVFVVITSIVLALLLLSFFIGRVGG